MGKNEFLTPKAIANRIKAKGLQKLRWYCQMCQKQCRDENGFKCHCMSESHQRQMQIFGQNPNRIVGGYSEEFQRSFLDLMRTSHRFSRVAATVVYNEYIHDRHHVHMNSTRWATLTEFVKHLGREGFCKVEDTPKGWFITYIDRDSETLFRDRQKKKRARADLADEEKREREIKRQIEKAEENLPFVQPPPAAATTELSHDTTGTRVGFSLAGSKRSNPGPSSEPGSRLVFEDNEEKGKKEYLAQDGKVGKSALDELMVEEEKAKERSNRKDYWLFEGIVVKVLSKVSGDKGNSYYNQKGIVKRVIDRYVGEIQMIESGHVLRVDQEELVTVIPNIGGLVKIVNGAYRGSIAQLLGIDTDNYCAKVKIDKGVYEGKVLKDIEYEDICKMASGV